MNDATIADAPLTLTVLGNRSGMPRRGEPSSGYLLNADGTTVLFDCGPGIAHSLNAPEMLDAVFISHLHTDHCYDILPIAKSIIAPHVSYPEAGAAPEVRGNPEPIPLLVPVGARPTLRTLQALFPVVSSPALDRAIELAFDIREYSAYDQIKVGDCLVTAFPARHVVTTCGFRVDSPAGTLAYTGDTGWTDALVELANGVDVLLCEATLRHADSGPHGHLSAREAGILATEANVDTLILTHFSSTEPSWLDALRADACAEFHGPVHIAKPGAEFALHREDVP